MRKYVSSLLATAFSLFASAQDYDEFGVVPQTLTAGSVGTIALTLNNPNMDNVRALEFSIVLPKGWGVGSSGTFGDRAPKDKFGDIVATLQNNEHNDTGLINYIIYSTTTTGFSGNSGDIVSIKVNVPEGTPAGYYPITIKDIDIANSATDVSSNIRIAETTSYVRVGDPEEATLALSGVVPAFVNEALASEPSTALQTLDLTAATAINGTFHYVDARNVRAPEGTPLTLTTASFKRTVADDKYITVNLPFDATFRHYFVTGNNENTVTFDEENSYTKGTPALVLGSVEATANNVDLVGVENQTITDGYYIKDNMLWKVNGNAKISALRGYFESGMFHFNEAQSTSLRIVVNNGTPTGIENMATDKANTTYDLQGRRTEKAQNGVYIREGQKILIK